MGHASDPAVSILADEQRTIGRNGEFKSNQLVAGSFRTVSRALKRNKGVALDFGRKLRAFIKSHAEPGRIPLQ